MFAKFIALLLKLLLNPEADTYGSLFSGTVLYDARVVKGFGKKEYYLIVGSTSLEGGAEVKLFFGFGGAGQDTLAQLKAEPFPVGSTIFVSLAWDKKEWGKAQVSRVKVLRDGAGTAKIVEWKKKEKTEGAPSANGDSKTAPARDGAYSAETPVD